MTGEALAQATGYVRGLATTPEEEAVTDEVIRRINDGWGGAAISPPDQDHQQRMAALDRQVVDWLRSADLQPFTSADLPSEVRHAFVVDDVAILVVPTLGRFESRSLTDRPGEFAVFTFQETQPPGDVEAEALVVWERGDGDTPVRNDFGMYRATNAWPGVLDKALEMIKNPEPDPLDAAMQTLQ